MHMLEEKITTNGIRLNVASAGRGPVVLLLHGFPDTHATWRKQVPALVAAGYRVIAPDLRGYGRSDVPEKVSDYTLDVLRADIIGLLDAIGIERVYQVGHDWGAAIGWQLCIHAPERLERFAALSVGHPTAYRRAGIGQALKVWYAAVFMVPGLSEKILMAWNLLVLRGQAVDDAQLAQWRTHFSDKRRVTAALNYYRANATGLLSADRGLVRTPVLGVWSEADPALTQAQMRDSARYVKGSFRYERISGQVGHWLHLREADRINALLLEFGGGVPA